MCMYKQIYRFSYSVSGCITSMMHNVHECMTVQYCIIMYESKFMDFLHMSGELFSFHVSASLISFLASKRTGISQYFRTFPIFDFACILKVHGCRIHDSEQTAEQKQEAKQRSGGTPTPRFASAVDKNTLSFAIFFG